MNPIDLSSFVSNAAGQLAPLFQRARAAPPAAPRDGLADRAQVALAERQPRADRQALPRAPWEFDETPVPISPEIAEREAAHPLAIRRTRQP